MSNDIEREAALDCALSGQSYNELLIDSVCSELNAMAFDLKAAHTVNGEWRGSERDILEKHDHLKRMAVELRKLKAARAQGAEPVAWDDPAVDPIVSKLYRKFKEWSQRGFTADDVTWCEVRGYVAELLNARAQGAEPVAWVAPTAQGTFYGETVDSVVAEAESFGAILAGTIPLYTHPPKAQGVPEGWKTAAAGAIDFALDLDNVRRHPRVAAEHIKGLARLICTATPPSDKLEGEWVKCSDRLPKMQDADCYGQVIGWDSDNKESVIGPPCDFKNAPWLTHWMSTRLRDPAAPDMGGEK